MCAGVLGLERRLPPPPQLWLYTAVLQQRLLALGPAALGAVGVTLCPVAVLLIGAGPHARPHVLRDKQGHQQRQQHRARAEQEGRPRDDGALKQEWHVGFKHSFRMCHLLFVRAGVSSTYLVGGVGHVGFSTGLGAVRVGQLHVEQVEDKTVESGAQTVTEASNSSNHPLDNTCRRTDINTIRNLW